MQLKILAAASMALFSLLSVFAATTAWFDSVRSLDDYANQMQIDIIGNLHSIEVYRADTADADGYVFSQTPAQEIIVERWESGAAVFKCKNAGDTEYTSYDTAPPINMTPDIIIGEDPFEDPFTPLSPYHPLYLVFTYRETVDAATDRIKITAETQKSFLTPAKSPTGASLTPEPLSTDSNPMSSFIQTYALGYGEEEDVKFNFTTAELGTLQHSSFASLDGEGYPVFNSSPTFFEDNTNSLKRVGIIFEYYFELIEYIYYYHVGDPILDNTIRSLCDWRLFV